MGTWKDRLGRDIAIETWDDAAFASHNGKQIGEVTTTGPREMDKGPDEPPQIDGMFVDADYQNAGIGLRLIEELYLENGEEPLLPAEKNVGIGGRNALTDAGERLTKRAQQRGFVLPFDER